MKEQDIQELLKPRYKVIADYPNGAYKIGAIIHLHGVSVINENYYNKYPHLFKPLAWYEERDQSQMPEYVWFSKSGRDKIYKVIEWRQSNEDHLECRLEGLPGAWNPKASCLTPKTKTEYNQYLNQQKLENKI